MDVSVYDMYTVHEPVAEVGSTAPLSRREFEGRWINLVDGMYHIGILWCFWQAVPASRGIIGSHARQSPHCNCTCAPISGRVKLISIPFLLQARRWITLLPQCFSPPMACTSACEQFSRMSRAGIDRLSMRHLTARCATSTT